MQRENKKIEISGREYFLYKFPATDGRKIAAKYSISSLPKVGDYEENEKAMYEMLRFVSVKIKEAEIFLNDKSLVDKYVPSFVDLLKIEACLWEFNTGFFLKDVASSFFQDMSQSLEEKATSILTKSFQRLSQVVKQP